MASTVNRSNLGIAWAARGAAFLFGLATLSQVALQTIERGHTMALADKSNRLISDVPLYAKRGAIYGADGKPLAIDESALVLVVQFDKVPHDDGFYMDLSRASGIPASEFASQANAGKPNVAREWSVPLGPAQSQAVQEVKYRWRADGVSLRNTGRRSYPLGQDLSSLVGLFRDGRPMSGLELSKNQVLAGQNGRRRGFVDRQGHFLPTRVVDGSVEKRDGTSITLTIDPDLQALASAAVRQSVKEHAADNGVAVVLDPKNGDILAMANAPSFEPYEPDGSDGDLGKTFGYNSAYMGVLEPGSTFKILTLAKALDDGKVRMGDHLYCRGVLQIGKRSRIRCDAHHGNRAHGDLTPLMAIAKSCNVSAATWALRVGREPFFDYIDKLGLVKKPDLGLPREAVGLLRRNEPAVQLQLATIGFGQSITTSPVALAGAFGMIANNGLRVAPRLVKQIGGHSLPPDKGTEIVKPETAAEVMTAMEAVFSDEHGTGHGLRIPGYRLAGKTGTAQKVGKHEKGYVSNFVGFVPAQNPRAVILVMINNPKQGGYYGAAVAGPVFQQIAKGVIRRYALQPTEPMVASHKQEFVD